MSNCSVTYKEGKISSVLEDGKTPEMFSVINKIIKDKDKAYMIYSKIRDGVSVNARVNSQKAVKKVSKSLYTTEEVEQNTFVNDVIGTVDDLGARKNKTGTSRSETKIEALKRAKLLDNLTKETSDVNEINNLKTQIKELIGKAKPSRVAVKEEVGYTIGKNNEGEYVLTATLENESVGSITIKEGKLELPKVISLVEGNGIGRSLVTQAISEAIEKEIPLTLDKGTFSGMKKVLEAYADEGVLRDVRGKYELIGSKVGGIKEAISSLNNDSESLSLEMTTKAINLMMSLGMTSNLELQNKMKSLEENGVIVFTEENLSKVFNKYEVSMILSSPELIAEIQQIRNKIGSTDINLEYDPMFVFKGSSELLGPTQKIINPNVVEVEVREAVAGEQNVSEALPEKYLQLYNDSQDFRDYVERIAKDYGKPKKMKLVDGKLVESKGDTAGRFNLILDDRSKSIASSQLDVLSEFDQNQYEIGYNKWLADTLNQLGIEYRSVEAKVLNTEARENTERMIELIEEGKFTEASQIYDKVLNEAQPEVQVVYAAENSDVYVDEAYVSESEMFEEFNLLKIKGKHYTEVDNSMSAEEMINVAYASVLNKSNNTLEEFTAEVKANAQKMGLTLNQELAIKNYLYKEFLGVEAEIVVKQQAKTYQGEIEDLDYIKQDFIKDFNDYLILSGNQHFKITSKGIEFKYDDQLSIREAMESLPENIASDMVQYSKVAKNMEEIKIYKGESNEDIDSKLMHPAETRQVEFYDPSQEARDKAFNNPMSLPTLDGNIRIITSPSGETIITKEGEQRDYLERYGKAYERVAYEGGIGFYKMAPETSNVFFEGKLEPVKMDMDVSEYTHLASIETATEIHNVFEKGEKNKIEEEFFKC